MLANQLKTITEVKDFYRSYLSPLQFILEMEIIKLKYGTTTQPPTKINSIKLSCIHNLNASSTTDENNLFPTSQAIVEKCFQLPHSNTGIFVCDYQIRFHIIL